MTPISTAPVASSANSAAVTPRPTSVPATRCRPRTICWRNAGAPSGTTAETIAQYGCPIPLAVATNPASSTASPLRATCQRHRAAYAVRTSGARTGPRRRSRRSRPPAAPTTTANAADSPATTSAVTTSTGRLSSEAHAANAKTRNSGPRGCQSWRSESSEPPAARAAVSGTAHQARCSESPTTTPPAVARVSSTARVPCMRSREIATWVRP